MCSPLIHTERKEIIMNSFRRSCVLFAKKYVSAPVNREGRHYSLLCKTWLQLQEMVQVSLAGKTIPEAADDFSPYGFSLGCPHKNVLQRLGRFRISDRYDLSVSMNRLYKVYFVEMHIDKLHMVSQFHVLNDELYLSRTDFLTRLFPFQYEKMVKEIAGEKIYTDVNVGIHPFYIRDKQPCLLRLHNPLGYPSLMYYREGTLDKQAVSVPVTQKLFS